MGNWLRHRRAMGENDSGRSVVIHLPAVYRRCLLPFCLIQFTAGGRKLRRCRLKSPFCLKAGAVNQSLQQDRINSTAKPNFAIDFDDWDRFPVETSQLRIVVNCHEFRGRQNCLKLCQSFQSVVTEWAVISSEHFYRMNELRLRFPARLIIRRCFQQQSSTESQNQADDDVELPCCVPDWRQSNEFSIRSVSENQNRHDRRQDQHTGTQVCDTFRKVPVRFCIQNEFLRSVFRRFWKTESGTRAVKLQNQDSSILVRAARIAMLRETRFPFNSEVFE